MMRSNEDDTFNGRITEPGGLIVKSGGILLRGSDITSTYLRNISADSLDNPLFPGQDCFEGRYGIRG